MLPITAPARAWLHPRWCDREECRADWHAAAGVAAYDYLLPLCGPVVLLPDAVMRFVAELGEYPAGRLSVVRSRIGVPVALYARDVVADADGFGARALRRIARRNRADVWEPLARRMEETGRSTGKEHSADLRRWLHPATVRVALLIGTFALTGWAVATGEWVAAAVPATGAVLSGVALRVHQLVRKEE